MRRYFTAMGFRLVCGILAILTTGWVRWSLIGAALVLPYVAVVLANAVGPSASDEVERVDQEPVALHNERSPADDGPSTIQGTVLGAVSGSGGGASGTEGTASAGGSVTKPDTHPQDGLPGTAA